MDSHSSFEDANQEGSFIMSKDVLMTCLVALIYISFVVALMVWCRFKRNKARRSRDDIENKNEGENDDTASDGDEENKVNFSVLCFRHILPPLCFQSNYFFVFNMYSYKKYIPSNNPL